MIREVGGSIGRAVLDGIGRAASRLQERRALSVDLLESDDAYLAVFDAPGATATDIGVRFEGNSLSVRIDRFREFYDGYEMVFPGRGLSLSGDVDLPEGATVEADEADATLTRNGTLEVLIPKSDSAANDTDDETSSKTDVETISGADAGDSPGDGTDTPEDAPDTQ
jgi:HSP20 family molecular chaperone IbpA